MDSFQLGIDVAKHKLDCALRRPDGKYRNKTVSNDAKGFAQLAEWLVKQGAASPHVCMEATSVYWEDVAVTLANQGMTLSVVNPAQIKAFGASRLTRSKTDQIDAQLIAEFCHERCPEPWTAPSQSEQRLRAMVLRLDALQAMHTQESNRLEVAREVVHDGIAHHLQWLDASMKDLVKQIRDHIDSDPDLRNKRDLLNTVPGVGERTISMLLAFSLHHERFANARQVAAYAGLDPRQHESGSSVRGKPRLSKVGHAFIRKALYMPAVSTLYRTLWGQKFRERLLAANKPSMLIIGAMMREILHIAFGVLKSGKPFDSSLQNA